MKRYMHGLGEDPKEGARLLKKMGFSGVVGAVSTVEETLANGMESYLCSGAYRGPDFKGEEWLAQDIYGNKIVWFYSTCPTRKEVREYNLENIRRMAQTPGIKGVLIDGARFSSPASGIGEDPTASFFTCFCDKCMEKARSMGFDPDRMKRSVYTLKKISQGEKEAGLLTIGSLLPGLNEWMNFRRAATTEHLKAFCAAVHRVDPDLEAGIYIFAPSLSTMVGQSYQDLKKDMDLFAPMLYRCYDDRNGASCLNSEAARMLDLTEKIRGMRQDKIRKQISDMIKLPLDPSLSAEEVFRKGYETSILTSETKRARDMIGSKKLIPIIELDDPKLKEASEMTMKGGAEAVNYFVFNKEQIENNEAFFCEN